MGGDVAQDLAHAVFYNKKNILQYQAYGHFEFFYDSFVSAVVYCSRSEFEFAFNLGLVN